jgi:hypothetical protein
MEWAKKESTAGHCVNSRNKRAAARAEFVKKADWEKKGAMC